MFMAVSLLLFNACLLFDYDWVQQFYPMNDLMTLGL